MSKVLSRTSMLTTGEAAAYLGLSVSYLNKLRVTGNGPAYFKLSRAVRYRLEDLDDWASDRRFRSTSAVPQRSPEHQSDRESPQAPPLPS
jgi:excisionase family DNA binding protein